jgi:hypothetical protein
MVFQVLLCGECYEHIYTQKPLKVYTRHSPHINVWNTIVKLTLKHPALPVEATLNRNYLR